LCVKVPILLSYFNLKALFMSQNYPNFYGNEVLNNWNIVYCLSMLKVVPNT